MSTEWLMRGLMILVPLLLSLSVHEWAHAYAAWRLGDDTAAREGRLTLNPLAHIDPLGTILVPLMGIPFGWAKPVPVQPNRFRRDVSMRKGMMITAFAGPLSNVVLALACAIVLGALARFSPELVGPRAAAGVLLMTGIQLNVALAIFNMLPIPPLDGSRIVDGLVPPRLEARWEAVGRYAPLLLGAVIVLPLLLGTGSLLHGPIRFLSAPMYQLSWWIAG